MKFNKWTLGLAAVGVVSLASAVKAEEKASSVMTALSSTTLSGYVDTSAQWNLHSPNSTPNGYLPAYKFGGPKKADGFNLNVVQIRIEKQLDEAEWAAGYRVDLWAGPDANTLGTQSNTSTGAADFAIRQAYVALRMPVGNGIDWKVGVFDSIIGYESVESGSNPNYTRSFGHSIEPQTHTGILASYRFNDMISASAGMANTVRPTINRRAPSETYKTYMGSIALTAPTDWGFLSGSSLYGGIVNGFSGIPAGGSGNQTSWYAGATVATPVTGLKCGLAFDYLDAHDSTAYDWTLAGYVSYQATEKLSLHGRAEYARGTIPTSPFTSGFATPYTSGPQTSSWVYALTGTVQYDLWKNVLSRVEIRYDHAKNTDFGGAPGRHHDLLLAANIIYKF